MTGQSENLLYYAAKIYADRALKHDLNAMIAITGEMGAGKSSLALKLAEILRDEHGLKFSADNIYFDMYEFADDLARKRKHVMIIEEAGVQLYSRNFMTELNRFIAQISQMLRFRNDIIIFTLPHIRLLDKTVRILLQHIWRVRVVGDGQGGVKRQAKPYIVFTDYIHDTIKIVPAKYKTPYGGYNEFPWIEWSMPSRELWQEYNIKKERFFLSMLPTTVKNLKVEIQRVLEDPEMRKILFAKYSKERRKLIERLAKKYGVSTKHLYRVIREIQKSMEGNSHEKA